MVLTGDCDLMLAFSTEDSVPVVPTDGCFLVVLTEDCFPMVLTENGVPVLLPEENRILLIQTGNAFPVVPTETRVPVVLIGYGFVVIQIEYAFSAILGNEGIPTDLILNRYYLVLGAIHWRPSIPVVRRKNAMFLGLIGVQHDH